MLLDGWRDELNRSNNYSHTIEHKGERGAHNESALRRILRAVLPKKVGVGSGFIEFSNSQQSTQQDIILFDAVNYAPLYANDDCQIYPVEMVLATIEVKSKLTSDDLEKILKNCANLRASSSERRHLKQSKAGQAMTLEAVQLSDVTPPRFFVFCYDAYTKDSETLCNRLIEASKHKPKSHLHGLCILNHDWHLWRRAFDGNTHDYKIMKTGGWAHFLLNIYPILIFPPSELILDPSAYLERS